MMPDRCIALPPEVLARPDLPTIALAVAAALNDQFARFDPCTWVGNHRLADAVGRSVGHVRRGLAALVNCGLVGRETTDEVPNGRRLWLLWREDGAQPPRAPARTYVLGQSTAPELRDVTKLEATEERLQEAHGAACTAGRPVGRSLPRACDGRAVATIPALIQALKLGAPSEARAELVNRIAHRLHDKQPETYGFIRKWVNAAADGVAGALEALAHGYAKAEAALLCNHRFPGRVLVRRVQDFAYRPPAPSTIGAVEPHVAARPVPLTSAFEPAEPPPTLERVAELECQARIPAGRAIARMSLAAIAKGGPEVPPDVQEAAAEVLTYAR